MAVSVRISNEAVKKATGRDWAAWKSALDKLGAKALAHRDIAKLLAAKKLIKSAWWAQMVTVGYEYMQGRRETGKTADTGWQVGVSRTFEKPAREMWRLLTSPQGEVVWLGVGAPEKWKVGEEYHTADGTEGEVRSVKPGARLRLTWKPRGWEKPSTLQLYIAAKGKKCSVTFHHENLPDKAEREEMAAHWRGVLERLAVD